MPTVDDLINSGYQETWADKQACQEYDEWLDAEDERRKALRAQRKLIINRFGRTQKEIELDPDYNDDF